MFFVNIQHKIFPRIFETMDLNKKENLRNSTSFIHKEIPIIERHLSYDREINKQIKNNPFFKKVSCHIEEKKKILSEE